MAVVMNQRARRSLSDDVLEMVTARMRILAEPVRLRLMWLLDREGGATVQELCDRLSTPTTHQNVSKHLGVLYQAGLVVRTREGNCVRYSLADWTALWVIEQIAASVAAQLEAQHEQFIAPAQAA